MTGFWAVALCVSLALSFFSDWPLFAVFGCAACLVVTLPVLDRRYDLASPWSFVMLTIYIGCGLRSVFLAARIEGGRSLDALFLLGRDPGFFVPSSALFVAALLVLTLAYLASSRPVVGQSAPSSFAFNKVAPFLIAGCAVMGFVAFLGYAQQTGGLSLARLSGKRTSIDGLDLANYESFGVWRQLSELSDFALWSATAFFAYDRKRRGFLSVRWVILAVLFVNAAALPFYASSRSDVAYSLIIAVVIHLSLTRERARVGRTVVQGVVVVAALVSILTVLRIGNAQEVSYTDAERGPILAAVEDTFVFNRNFTDIPTSVQVMEAVGTRLEPARGSTYAAWAVAWIPRSWWPDKPLISAGPQIGVKVFGQQASGVPPGFVAEAYWNFGIPGILLGSVMLGFALRRIYEAARPRLGSPLVVTVYAGAFMQSGEQAMANGLGYAMFQTLVAALPLTALMLLCRARKTATTRPQLSAVAC